ncbi:MAG: Amidohydrolase 3 [Proteobacteria bacterium]|nr:Amidohydrolase 3 [Pseudomonadota bacterium]
MHSPKLRVLLVSLALCWGGANAAPNADLVLRNGAIYTVEPGKTWVEAVAVKDGKYVAVGRNADVTKWIGKNTQVVDLAGAMAMPGLNDVHQHPLEGGYESLYSCNIPANAAFEAMLEQIKRCVEKAEPGDWIVGGSWGSQHIDRLASLEGLKALDDVTAGHPTFLRDDTYHNRWVNSEALRRANITATTANPEGGIIVKDAKTNQPVGLVKEFAAFHPIEALIPPRSKERLQKAAAAAIAINNGFGITGIQDAFSSEGYLKVWNTLDRGTGVNAWLIGSMPAMPAPDPTERYGQALIDARHEFRTEHVRPDFAKLFLDGVPPARTSFFIKPYLEDAAHGAHFHGEANYSQKQLTDMLAKLDKQGIPVKMHATGDASVRLALDAIAEVRARNGAHGPRHHIAHASFVAPEDIARFKQLNVVADESPMLWFPTGLWYAIVAAIGQERALHFWPMKDLLKSGALLAGGSDWPAGQDTPNPWIGIEGMVTRRNPTGEVPGALWPEQAISLSEALRAYTLSSAKAMGLEKTTGSIKPGKSADLIVLDRHLFKIPADQIDQVAVQRTYFQGRLVYERPAQAKTP